MLLATPILASERVGSHTLRSVSLPPAWRSEAASLVLIFLSRSDMPCAAVMAL